MTDISKNQSSSLDLPKSGSVNLDTNQIVWSEGGNSGFHYKQLLEAPVARQRTWLMKVDAGAFTPRHTTGSENGALVLLFYAPVIQTE